MVSVSLTSETLLSRAGNGIFALRLLSPSGRSLAWDFSGSDSRQLVAELPVDGRYLVRVRNPRTWTEETGPYVLLVRVARVTPEPLAMDTPVIGIFDVATTRLGIWEFDGRAGQAVVVAAASHALELRFDVVSPSGKVISGTERWADRRYPGTVLLPVSGRYRVRVTADGDGVGAYEVAVRSMAVSPREGATDR